MNLFRKNKRKSILDAANDLKHEVEGEVLPSQIGMDPDEIERLLELLRRDDVKSETKRVVFRRRVGSILDVAKGLVFWLRPYRLTLDEAIALIHDIAERHKEREQRLLKQRRRKDPDYQLPKYMTLDDVRYPLQLSADDVLAASNAARQRLAESPREREAESAQERCARRIFEALEQLKNDEATQFARQVAMTQRRHLEGKPNEDATPENAGGDVWAAHGIDDEELERIRTLQGFGKKPLKTLIDEAGEVVDANVESAAKVVKQWIGNAVGSE